MKSRILPMLALVLGAALLARGAAAQPSVHVVAGIVSLGNAVFHDVAVDPASNRVYATFHRFSGQGTNEVAVIDGASNELVGTVPVSIDGGMEFPGGMGVGRRAVDVNSTTSRVYVTVPDSNSVSVIDGTTNTVVATVPVGESPTGVAVNPTTNLIYVTDAAWSAWSGTVSVIDGGSNTVVATIPVNQWPLDVAVNPVTNLIYVANAAWSGTISVIDGGSNTVVGNIPVGFSPQRVAVNPNTNSVYVAMETPSSGESGDLLVIDGTTNTVAATFPGMEGQDVAVNPSTNHVFVARGEHIAVIDGATNSVVTSIPLAWQYCLTPGGVAVAVNPITSVVYVGANQYWFACSEMYVINDSPGAVPPPAPSPTPTPLPAPTPMPCLPAPAPSLAEGMEWVALQCGTCNAVTTTYPDSTPVGTIAGAVAPPGTFKWLWRFGGDTWQGWSPTAPQASDLTEVDRLDVVFICVEDSATFTRPVI